MSNIFEQRQKQLLSELDALIDAVREERHNPRSKVGADLLVQMECCLESTHEHISETSFFKKNMGMTLTRLIAESWPLGDSLGNRISEFESRMYQLLGR